MDSGFAKAAPSVLFAFRLPDSFTARRLVSIAAFTNGKPE
jgi:hypothetical protein